MEKEHIEFLSKLKKELLEQPTDGNRDPRYWGIRETRKEYGYESEYAEGWEVYDGENGKTVGLPNDTGSAIETFIADYEMDKSDFDESHDQYDYMDKSDITDIVHRANQIMRKAYQCPIDGSYTPYEVVYYREYSKVNEDALFLTKKACQEHIAKYGYNYSNPRTYVMTAYRCPEYETLLNTIKETEWGQEEDDDKQL